MGIPRPASSAGQGAGNSGRSYPAGATARRRGLFYAARGRSAAQGGETGGRFRRWKGTLTGGSHDASHLSDPVRGGGRPGSVAGDGRERPGPAAGAGPGGRYIDRQVLLLPLLLLPTQLLADAEPALAGAS